MQARRRVGVGRRVGGWAWEEEPYVIGGGIVHTLYYIQANVVKCSFNLEVLGMTILKESTDLRTRRPLPHSDLKSAYFQIYTHNFHSSQNKG